MIMVRRARLSLETIIAKDATGTSTVGVIDGQPVERSANMWRFSSKKPTEYSVKEKSTLSSATEHGAAPRDQGKQGA